VGGCHLNVDQGPRGVTSTRGAVDPQGERAHPNAKSAAMNPVQFLCSNGGAVFHRAGPEDARDMLSGVLKPHPPGPSFSSHYFLDRGEPGALWRACCGVGCAL